MTSTGSAPTPNHQHGTLTRDSLLAAGFTIVLWASAFAGIRAGLKSYSPENVALLRYLVASVLLIGYAYTVKMPLPSRRDWPGIALLGFLGFTVYNVALNAGEVGVSAGVASFVVATAPVFMAGLAFIVLGERLGKWGWGGIALSFLGVAVISLLTSDGVRVDERVLLVLIAAIVQAFYSVGQKPYLTRYGGLRFAVYAIWSGTAFLLIFVPGLIGEIRTASTESTLAVVYMGVFPGAMGYLSWSYVLEKVPASQAGSFLYLIPGTAVLIAWLWLGEVPDVLSLVGGVLIIAGVYVVHTRGRR